MLWRETDALSTDYPDVVLSHMYVDNAAMQLVREPKQLVTEFRLATFSPILLLR